MKRNLIILFLTIFVGITSAQNFYQRMRDDIQNGRLTELQAVYLDALRAFQPDQLPEEYRIDDVPVKSATGLLFTLRHHWSSLNPEQRGILSPHLARPVLPLSIVSPGGQFRIHYTTTVGDPDRVSPEDLDMSGVPDYVEETALAADKTYTQEVETLGFRTPPEDQGEGGWEYDIYIVNLSWAYGYTEFETQLTSNPDTYTSFMVIDNDYIGFPTPFLDGMRVTVAHEFHHMIQFGYNVRDDDNNGWPDDLFIMEASSTWMEDIVYDDINDYVYYLSEFFRETNMPFDDDNGLRMYALCIWFHFLEERMGDRTICKDLWDEIIEQPAIEAMGSVLQNSGFDFEEELSIFYGWNYLTGSRADTARFYPEGDTYPETVVDAFYGFTRDTTITGEVKPTAARYYQFQKTDGDLITIIPANINMMTGDPSETFILDMALGGSRPFFIDLSNGVQASLSPGDVDVWRCVAIVESPGQQALLIPFKASVIDLDSDDLPFSFPNPFCLQEHEQTTIPFMFNETGTVKILIVDAAGYRIKKEGQYYIDDSSDDTVQFYTWNGRDGSGQIVPAGIYVYLITWGNTVIRKGKLAVIR